MNEKSLLFFRTVLFLIFLIPAPDVRGEQEPFRPVIDRDGVQRVDILGGEYYFKPDHIIVRRDIPVELRVRKESLFIPHNIIMNEPEAGIVFRESFGRKPQSIRFTPKKTGRFPFFCDKRLLLFRSHREQGMKGTLEVTE